MGRPKNNVMAGMRYFFLFRTYSTIGRERETERDCARHQIGYEGYLALSTLELCGGKGGEWPFAAVKGDLGRWMDWVRPYPGDRWEGGNEMNGGEGGKGKERETGRGAV